MNSSMGDAYKVLYNLLPIDYKESLFNKAVNDMCVTKDSLANTKLEYKNYIGNKNELIH